MIDLAPHNPYSVPLRSPVLIGAGCVVRDQDLAQIGAVLTQTTTVHTLHLPPPTWAAVPSGVLYSHQPTISVRTLLRDEARRWNRSPVPIWATITGTAPDLGEIAARLDGVEGLAGLVIFAGDDDLSYGVRAVRQASQLPLLAVLALEPQIALAARRAVEAGADALVVAAPPVGTAYQHGELITGRIYGPAVVPHVLHALSEVTAAVEVPLVARGGVGNVTIAQSYLRAGAAAVIVDAARWGEPHAPERIAGALEA